MKMCGRFAGFRSLNELKKYFPIDRSDCEVVSNYNVAPSQEILAIIKRDGENWLEKLHWGLVPFWAKDTSVGNRMINARVETVSEKPGFRNAFKKRRCLIIADGFYEWKGEKGSKQPMFITLPDKKPLAFAGLWETWNSKDSEGAVHRSCTIITTQSSESIKDIHHRMPVILKPQAYEPWLEPGNRDVVELKKLLKNEIETDLDSYPVSKQVNSARNNDPSCIDPIE